MYARDKKSLSVEQDLYFEDKFLDWNKNLIKVIENF